MLNVQVVCILIIDACLSSPHLPLLPCRAQRAEHRLNHRLFLLDLAATFGFFLPLTH